jgi:exodeoxyribonuclease VII small subunit
MAAKNENPFNFEKALEELNVLVEELEHGSLALEKSLQHFEQGVNLIRQCQAALKAAEQKIEIISQEPKSL